jgi:hypothetical protein
VRGIPPAKTAYASAWLVPGDTLDGKLASLCAEAADSVRSGIEALQVDWQAVKAQIGRRIRERCNSRADELSCVLDLSIAAFGAADVLAGTSTWNQERRSARGARAAVLEVAGQQLQAAGQEKARALAAWFNTRLIHMVETLGVNAGGLSADGRMTVSDDSTRDLVLLLEDPDSGLTGARVELSGVDSVAVLPFDKNAFNLATSCNATIDSATRAALAQAGH